MKRTITLIFASSLLLQGTDHYNANEPSDSTPARSNPTVRFSPTNHPPRGTRVKKRISSRLDSPRNRNTLHFSLENAPVISSESSAAATNSRRGSLPEVCLEDIHTRWAIAYGQPSNSWPIIQQRALKPGMWGTEGYTVPPYTFDNSQLKPLTKEMVSTPFFVQLEKVSTKKRTELLGIATDSPGGHREYLTRRYNMIAILLSGTVCLSAVQEKNKNTVCWLGLLSQSVYYHDLYLTNLLLAGGALVHERRDPMAMTPLYAATTALIAKPLINYGALNNPEYRRYLLHGAMRSYCSTDLVAEYRANNLNPLERLGDAANRTPLACLIDEFGYATMAEKATVLLAKLPTTKIRFILNNVDDRPGTAFTRIAYQKRMACDTARSYFKTLFNVLVKKGKEAGMPAEIFEDCSLCSSMLCKRPMRVTLCKHRFHATCVSSHTICPACSQPLISEEAEQQYKNDMLSKARLYPAGISKYPLRRERMIEALHLGANIPAIQKQLAQEGRGVNLLQQATRYGDVELMQLMIECGADIHELEHNTQAPAIFYAKGLPEAKLLVGYGALNHPRTQQDLLVRAGGKGYDPKLITYYKKRGLKPTQQDGNGRVVLMEIIWHSIGSRLDKTKRVLDNISPKELSALLTMKNKSRKENVFDCIKRAQKNPKAMHSDEEPEVAIARLEEVAHYLREKAKEISAVS